ncbi:Ger(x)C family spore germination protein [Cohnella soli]|uniref:Ger(X)C family spore germination protein n=1 Tax=Cohnella soli TaxID=425005 RepID=A0ABW0HWL4_9BACL
MKPYRWLPFGLALVFLSGCWDQQLLKEERTISIGGLDQDESGMLRATVSIRDDFAVQTAVEDKNEIHTVVARSTQNARQLINAQVAGNYSAAKMRVLLFGEDLVRNHDIMPYLDAYYRDSRSPLGARIAVTQGAAENFIRLKKVGTRTIGVFVDQLLKSTKDMDITPNVNLQTLHPLDRGYDFCLPYLTSSNGIPTVDGLALFSGVTMTGKLNIDDSRLYLLLSDVKSKNLTITLKSVNREQASSYDFVTFAVHRFHRKLRVSVSQNRIKATLQLKLKVYVVEDPSDHLYKMKVMHQLEKLLSKELTEKAEQVIYKMQQANHDGFGIARRLMSYYPDFWKQINWNKEYPRVSFDTRVSLEILNTGITE